MGEPPANMSAFWKALMNPGLPRSMFSAVNFTVFGLGDSGYPDYNIIARTLWARM
jgi:sulfite reductase alpha subunit-like flavoprotein